MDQESGSSESNENKFIQLRAGNGDHHLLGNHTHHSNGTHAGHQKGGKGGKGGKSGKKRGGHKKTTTAAA